MEAAGLAVPRQERPAMPPRQPSCPGAIARRQALETQTMRRRWTCPMRPQHSADGATMSARNTRMGVSRSARDGTVTTRGRAPLPLMLASRAPLPLMLASRHVPLPIVADAGSPAASTGLETGSPSQAGGRRRSRPQTRTQSSCPQSRVSWPCPCRLGARSARQPIPYFAGTRA